MYSDTLSFTSVREDNATFFFPVTYGQAFLAHRNEASEDSGPIEQVGTIYFSLGFELRKVQSVASCCICSMYFTKNKPMQSIDCDISTR
jgi:hypothetical protein